MCRVSLSRTTEIPWKTRKEIIDEVHRHVCGHSNFNDIKTLPERNTVWNEDCADYLRDLLGTCIACHEITLPMKMRNVSLNNFFRRLNQLCFVDFFQLDSLQLFHCVKSVSLYSLAVVVDSLTLREAIAAFEQSLESHFWVPESIQADETFQKRECQDYLKTVG